VRELELIVMYWLAVRISVSCLGRTALHVAN